MSTKSNDQGRAYEYAWIQTLYKALSKVRNTTIVDNSSLKANKKAWETLEPDEKVTYKISADAAIDTVIELEPRLSESSDDDFLLLEFQSDDKGTAGDVRDIVMKREAIMWEVGLSIKHNHDAIKHSRLSRKLDFGKEWFSVPCSKDYWSDVKPIFDRLGEYKKNGVKWSEIDDKDKSVYVPLLQAFIDEIQRAYSNDADLPRKMIEYLIGIKDYYKIVSKDSKRFTIIHTFNIHGTLNQPGEKIVSAITVPTIELPTELIALRFKKGSTNTVEMYLDNGWQLSFRIHNASTKAEPSLKFDVQFIGMPAGVLNIECRWHKNK